MSAQRSKRQRAIAKTLSFARKEAAKRPCHKHPYHSEARAKRALVEIWGRINDGASKNHREKAVYQCPRCRYWHLTSNEDQA